MSDIKTFRDLDVYQNAMALIMEIYESSKQFPVEERYALTDQIRRSSRSVCANIAEAWRKRRYAAAFIAKLNDAESEMAETQVWLEIAFHNGYVSRTVFLKLDDAADKIIAQIVKMIEQPEKWLIKPR